MPRRRAGIEEAVPVSDIVPHSTALLLCRAGAGDDRHPLWIALELLLGLDGKADQAPEGRRRNPVCRILAFGGYRVVTSSLGCWVVAPFTAHEEHGERGARQTAAIETDVQREGEMPGQGSDQESGNYAVQGQHGGHGLQTFNVANLFYTIATWFSVLFLFAAISHEVDNWFFPKKGKV